MDTPRPSQPSPRLRWGMALAWLWVSAPLAWGVAQTFEKAKALFH